MSGPYSQPGYNPQYGNPYGANAPPPAGWSNQGQQQQRKLPFLLSSCFVSEFQPPPMPMHHNMMGGHPGYAEEGQAGDKYNIQFSDATIRAAFIRKVFGLVTIMVTLSVFLETINPFSFWSLPQ